MTSSTSSSWGKHQERKLPATLDDPQHPGTCHLFLKSLQNRYPTSKFMPELAWVKAWLQLSKKFAVNNTADLANDAMINISVGLCTKLPATHNECHDVCQGILIDLDEKHGWITMVGQDGKNYRLSSIVVLGYE